MAASREGIARARNIVKNKYKDVNTMRFSVNFKSKHKQEANEIRCPFNQLGRIFSFMKDNPNKRYNIIADEKKDFDFDKLIEQIEFVKATAEDYTIQCGSVDIMQDLIKRNYNAFLRFPVADWETFKGLQDCGVSDIYIDGPLGFQCEKLKRSKHNKKILIRVSPTISPNASLSMRSPDTFFIRPEDLEKYESAIDIIDFKENDQDKEDALFSIYNRGTFNYNLSDLIHDLIPDVNNIMLNPKFTEHRLNCGQKCKIPGMNCHLCNNYFVLTDKVVAYLRARQKENVENS